MRPTEKELVDFIKADLLNDAKCAEEQARSGPFFPEKGIDSKSLRKYARECRDKAATDFTSNSFIMGWAKP